MVEGNSYIQDVDGNIVLVDDPDPPQEWVVTSQGGDKYTFVIDTRQFCKMPDMTISIALSRRVLPLPGLIQVASLGVSVRKGLRLFSYADISHPVLAPLH